MDRNAQQDEHGIWYSMQPDHSLNRAADGEMLVDAHEHEPPPPVNLPGVVITQPEDLPPGSFLPYEKQDRTPAALQHLEALAADTLGIDVQRLVSRRGTVTDGGSVAMFVEFDERMSTVAVGHVVVSVRGGDQRPKVSRWASVARAHEAYDRSLEELA